MGTGNKIYSNLPVDAANKGLPTGGGILTADATGTPKTSPLAIDTNVTTLAVPTNAAEIVVLCDVAIRVSEVVGMARYFKIGASTTQALPLGRSDNLYVRTDSGSGTLQFYFITV